MKIYHYHPDTNEYLGPDIADQDPLDKDNWLIPANSTILEPLPFVENKIVCFRNNQWVYKEKPKDPEPFDPTISWTYAEYRASEYPPITDYLDGIVKNDQEQIDKYINDCLAIKAKYPKPE